MGEALRDVTGYEVSCNSVEGVEWFNKGAVAFITLNGDSLACFAKSLEQDPDFLLVHCVLVSKWCLLSGLGCIYWYGQ
jgi:hypothetical protein